MLPVHYLLSRVGSAAGDERASIRGLALPALRFGEHPALGVTRVDLS